MTFFTNQLETITLSLAQVKCLGAAERNQVLWGFSHREGRTVAQVADFIDKTRQVVHYHTQALLEAGLLMAVGTQKKRSRTEKLYAWAMATYRHELQNSTKEYRQESLEAFRSTTRAMVREVEYVHAKADEDPNELLKSLFRHHYVRLRPEVMQEARARLVEYFNWLHEQNDPTGQAERYHILAYANPAAPGKRESKPAVEE